MEKKGRGRGKKGKGRRDGGVGKEIKLVGTLYTPASKSTKTWLRPLRMRYVQAMILCL